MKIVNGVELSKKHEDVFNLLIKYKDGQLRRLDFQGLFLRLVDKKINPISNISKKIVDDLQKSGMVKIYNMKIEIL